jgi:CheY-like chemotaxis protein
MTRVIMMVEDNPADAALFERRLWRSGLNQSLHVVTDGDEATRYLKGEGQYSDRVHFPMPSVLLIDLNVPGVDGFALIEWVRKNGETSDIPIIVYSGSASPEDAERAYALGANAYFVKLAKPAHFNLLFTAIRELSEKS